MWESESYHSDQRGKTGRASTCLDKKIWRKNRYWGKNPISHALIWANAFPQGSKPREIDRLRTIIASFNRCVFHIAYQDDMFHRPLLTTNMGMVCVESVWSCANSNVFWRVRFTCGTLTGKPWRCQLSHIDTIAQAIKAVQAFRRARSYHMLLQWSHQIIYHSPLCEDVLQMSTAWHCATGMRWVVLW